VLSVDKIASNAIDNGIDNYLLMPDSSLAPERITPARNVF
jgi:hypothetical protein